MRIRIVQIPPIASVDGIRLDCFHLGSEYEVGNSIGALFLAEGWAVPVELETEARFLPFGEGDLFDTRRFQSPAGSPPNLTRETDPPYVHDVEAAADRPRRKPPQR